MTTTTTTTTTTKTNNKYDNNGDKNDDDDHNYAFRFHTRTYLPKWSISHSQKAYQEQREQPVLYNLSKKNFNIIIIINLIMNIYTTYVIDMIY